MEENKLEVSQSDYKVLERKLYDEIMKILKGEFDFIPSNYLETLTDVLVKLKQQGFF